MACAHVAEVTFKWQAGSKGASTCDEECFVGDFVGNGDCEVFGGCDTCDIVVPRVGGVEQETFGGLEGHVDFADEALDFGEGSDGFAKGCGHAFEGILDNGVTGGNGRAEIDRREHHWEPRGFDEGWVWVRLNQIFFWDLAVFKKDIVAVASAE